MTSVDVLVLVGSAAFLASFYGWFYGSKRGTPSQAATARDGIQEVEIEVKGGYTPDHVVVRHGVPVRLNFRREESGECTERVVIPGMRVSKLLPAFEVTPVEFTPEQPGDYEFTCGMGMIHGTLTVT